MSRKRTAYSPIAEYAVLGDCHTAALVSRDGSVDWYCPVRFDAPAVFCRLLDANRGGYLSTTPTSKFRAERRYRGPTNVLETEFSTADGTVRLTDLMPIHQRTEHQRGYDVGTSQRLLRLVEGLSGEVELELQFKPTFDYARRSGHTELVPEYGAIARCDELHLTLACRGVALKQHSGTLMRGRFRVAAGQKLWVVLTCADDPDRAEEALAPVHCERQLERTLDYWQRWSAQCNYSGPYRDQVLRSALVLKLLTYEPTGAIVAAPTTSLPEAIGGVRNWDYRFAWLRDSSLVLYALMTIGYTEEAADFIHWLERAVGADPTSRPQIMYAIDGQRKLPEVLLDDLEGYRRSRPVRIGNAAAEQQQLDIYGELLRAASLYYRRGHADPTDAWPVLRGLVQQAADHWMESGHGIWEVRGDPRQFTYGKLMCWAALDVGVRLARDHQLDAPLERWCATRDQIRAAVLQHAFDQQLSAFTQSFDSPNLDASALIIPRIGFLPPTDPRVRSTVARIQQELMRDGLVYRYRTPDGVPGDEGTFTLCTFWLADALALAGQLDEAHALFERALTLCNDLGLYSEEIDPASGEQLGNFPQGFSHHALIGAAVDLAKAETHGTEHNAQSEAERSAAARSADGQRHHQQEAVDHQQ